MTWLTKTPIAVVRAHLEMMVRLQAEESLLGAAVASMGAGNRKRSQVSAQMSKWQRAAEPSRRRVASERATPGALRMIGIGYTPAKNPGNGNG